MNARERFMNTNIDVTHVMEPVVPGSYAVLTVGGATEETRIFAHRLANSDSGFPGDSATTIAETVEWPIVQRNGECLTVDVPAGEFGVYALSVGSQCELSTALLANRARLDWCYPTVATSGGELRFIGRNLASIEHYPSTDRDAPVSYGGLVENPTRLTARRMGTAEFVEISVRAVGYYEIRCTLPESFEPGEYEFFAHNGLGGTSAWSEPVTLSVERAEAWPEDVFSVDEYLATAGSVDAAIAAALVDIESNGGGILLFSARTYYINAPIILPRRTVVRGAGMDRTLLRLPSEEGPKPPYVAITGDGDFTVEDIRIVGVHAPILICAPKFVPDNFDDAFITKADHSDARTLAMLASTARNVTIQRCHLAQQMLRNCDRRSDKEHVARMKQHALSQAQRTGAYEAVSIHGENVAILDNIIYGGGGAVTLNRCKGARVSGNRLLAGPAGSTLMTFSRLIWPETGGAKVEGSYCREILVEDNEITAYSERARNLVALLYAGENMHLARNNIHGIEPTFDAEALLTHLWQARWISPDLVMDSAVTGRIVDPEGEVANECLDGACVEIVDGRGIGQLRRIVARKGEHVTLDKPWRVVPDATSNIVFTAPPPYSQLTIVDNTVVSHAVNIIIWGNARDVVIDGNYTADAPGITLWPIRLADDQKVWGGLAFTSVTNNIMDRGWSSPDEAGALDGATGFFYRATHDGQMLAGYDVLGTVIRNNVARNNTGIAVRTTFTKAAEGGGVEMWPTHHSGIVVENNHCSESAVGIAIEQGSNVVERGNTSHDVRFPLVWAPKPQSGI